MTPFAKKGPQGVVISPGNDLAYIPSFDKEGPYQKDWLLRGFGY